MNPNSQPLRAAETLKSGHELRPFQKEALDRLGTPSSGSKHLICVAPTGSGKSLIYERAIAHPQRRTLLLTPLVALARQQHQSLRSSGVPVTLASGEATALPPPPRTGAWILSPEMLQTPSRQSTLRNWQPNFLVVDECHCLWDWGEGFRPAFLEIPNLLQEYAIPQSLWLTATLPQAARKALRGALPSPCLELGGFDLPAQLKIKILKTSWPDRIEAVLRWVTQQKSGCMIFVATRGDTLRLSRLLEGFGKSVVAYHGGLSIEERKNIEAQVREQQVQVVVATSAFGMGMNYPHLESVLLWQSPASLLSLVQTIGRVGRGMTPGEATLLWDPGDFQLLEWTLGKSARRRQELIELSEFYKSPQCRRSWLKNYFDGVTLSQNCGSCDFCSHLEL
jgi:ATP-dependent DNA helicase RecQ